MTNCHGKHMITVWRPLSQHPDNLRVRGEIVLRIRRLIALDVRALGRHRSRQTSRIVLLLSGLVVTVAHSAGGQSSTSSIVVIGGRPGNANQIRQEQEELASLLKLRQCVAADFAAGRWAPIGTDGLEAQCESDMRSSNDIFIFNQPRPPSGQRAAAHLNSIDIRIQELQRRLGLPVDRRRTAPTADEDGDDPTPMTRTQCVRLVEFRDGRLVDAYDRAAERFRINRGVIDDLAAEEKVLTEDMPSTSEWAGARDAIMWNLETTSRLIQTASRQYEGATSAIIENPLPPAKVVLNILESAKSVDDAEEKLTANREAHIAQRTQSASTTLEDALTRALTSLTNVDRLQQMTTDREALKSTIATSLARVRSAIAGYAAAVTIASGDIDDINATKTAIDGAVRKGCGGGSTPQ